MHTFKRSVSICLQPLYPLLISSIGIPDPNCPGLPFFCDNTPGWEWAYYRNDAPNTNTGYPSFNPASLKTTTPEYTGTTGTIGLPPGRAEGGAPGPIYESTINLRKTQYAINHRAYLYACESGTYTFSLNEIDDVLHVWMGPQAIAYWNGTNSQALASYQFDPPARRDDKFFRIDLHQQQYYPLRFVFAGAQDGGVFRYRITSPSGQVVAGDQVRNSPYIFRQSCDGKAPKFLDNFGEEV